MMTVSDLGELMNEHQLKVAQAAAERIATYSRAKDESRVEAFRVAEDALEEIGFILLDVGKEGKTKGGLYHWQRGLWHRLALANSLYYFSANVYIPRKTKKNFVRQGGIKESYWQDGYEFNHYLVGPDQIVARTNIVGTEVQDAIEAMARTEFTKADIFKKPAINFREGISAAVQKRLGFDPLPAPQDRRDIIPEWFDKGLVAGKKIPLSTAAQKAAAE